METIIPFIFGLFVGSAAGVFCMSLITIAGDCQTVEKPERNIDVTKVSTSKKSVQEVLREMPLMRGGR